jgi:hypothetical protein
MNGRRLMIGFKNDNYLFIYDYLLVLSVGQTVYCLFNKGGNSNNKNKNFFSNPFVAKLIFIQQGYLA